MKILIALAAFSLLPMSGAVAEDPPAAQEQGAPRLEAQTEVDLGQVRRGQVVTGVFELRNAGNAVLNILNAKPG